MFYVPAYYGDISLKLASVLEDVGVNERIMLKRRRTSILREKLLTIGVRLNNSFHNVHIFGSQSEGTTTLGLESDSDRLYCFDANAFENRMDWKADILNVKMIQDKNISPGYCMLQKYYYDIPMPMNDVMDEHHVKLREGMVVLKNSLFDRFRSEHQVKNGPAFSSSGGEYIAVDNVYAIPCCKMPSVVHRWIRKQEGRGKLSLDMKRYIESNSCYVVPVGKKGSSNECIEWRISTSHVERCVLFNMNITQIRCYVLMKMILKSFLKHPKYKGLSSFMCKNVLLLCIEETQTESWRSSDLFTMVTICLFELQKCIIQKLCPHFIERRNNLMGRSFLHFVQVWLLQRVKNIIHSNGRALLKIITDDFGRRLQNKMNVVNVMDHSIATPDKISQEISADVEVGLLDDVSGAHRTILYAKYSRNMSWANILQLLARTHYKGSILERDACCFLQPLVFSSYGSFLTSVGLQKGKAISPDALSWLREGMNSDIASGRLKLASVLFAVGDFKSAESIIRSINASYDFGLVAAMCTCFQYPEHKVSMRFRAFADNHNDVSIRDKTAFCVRFLPSEINCIPRALKYELFRSSRDEKTRRDLFDLWMDWAVVESLPYMFFLMYKTYENLQRYGDQQLALLYLIKTAKYEYHDFSHRKTTWNLVGQCMEQEDKPADAFKCYVKSLNIRPRNNAASVHICRLLSRLIRR